MNETMANLIAFALVFAALCAEVNLIRVLMRESREDSRAKRSKKGRAPASKLRLAVAAIAASAGLMSAHADEPQKPEKTETTGAAPGTAAESGAAAPAAAMPEDKPLVISTDRPSFDDTAGIVPKGHFQLETGYTFTLNNHSGVNTQTNNAPEILVRYTVLEDRLELRLSTSGYFWTRTDTAGVSSTNEGFSDILPGFKLKLTDQEGWMPRLVFEGATTVGVGSDGISNQDVEPIGKLIWQYDLGKGWGVYGNFNIAYATTSGSGRFVQGQAGVCVTYAPTDKLSFYGEFFTFAPNAKGTSPAYYIDFGGAYLLTNRVQIDARAGFGMGRQSNNFFTGAGISVLF